MQIRGIFETSNGAEPFRISGYDEKDCAAKLHRFIGNIASGVIRSAALVSDIATDLRSIAIFWRAYDELSAPRQVSHPAADMLRTALACHERPNYMRLNPHLSESDIAATIRCAIACIEIERN